MTLGYLDAGNGSMLVGAAAAGFAGVATVGRMAWYKVSPKKRRKDAERAEAETADDLATDEDATESAAAPAEGVESEPETTA